jgi:hypothetical protein
MAAILVILPTPSLLTIVAIVVPLLRGEGGGLDRVVAAGFVVDLSDYGFNSDVAIISYVIATLAGVLSVRVLNREDELESRALLR